MGNPHEAEHCEEEHCTSFACKITAGTVKDADGNQVCRHKVRGWDTAILPIKDGGRGKPTHTAQGAPALLINVRMGNLKRVLQLLNDGNSPDYLDRNGSSPLIAACSSEVEQIKIVEALLEFDANPDLGRESRPIIEAANKGHCKIVQMLIDHGADVNAQKASEIHAERELANKISIKREKQSKIAAADEDIRRLEKESAWEKFRTCAMDKKMPLEVLDTALHRAVGNGDNIQKSKGRGGPERIVALLLNNKADLHKQDRFGCTPLAWATSEAVGAMLIFAGAEVEETWALPLSTEGTFGHRVERVRIEAKYRHRHITKGTYRDMMERWRSANKATCKEWWKLIEEEE